MKLLFVLLLLLGVVVQAQDLRLIPLTSIDIEKKVETHFQYESKDGHFSRTDLWLLRDGTFEFKISSNTYNAFSYGNWKQSKNIITLRSKYKQDNLPIVISYRPKDSLEGKLKKIAIVKDLSGQAVLNVFIFVNNDSTKCINGDFLCNGEFETIYRIKIQFENNGISSQWIPVKNSDELIQITILEEKNLGNYLVFNPWKYRIANKNVLKRSL